MVRVWTGIMEELATGWGENRLIRLNDQAYQSCCHLWRTSDRCLKEEIMLVRQGKDSEGPLNSASIISSWRIQP